MYVQILFRETQFYSELKKKFMMNEYMANLNLLENTIDQFININLSRLKLLNFIDLTMCRDRDLLFHLFFLLNFLNRIQLKFFQCCTIVAELFIYEYTILIL